MQRYFSYTYVTAHRCAGGLKKKLNLGSGSQRHRHFVGFYNVPVQAPTRGHPFYTVIWSSPWGGGVLIVQIVKKMKRWTKKQNITFVVLLSNPHSCIVTPSVDQNQTLMLLKKGTRCFCRSFTPVWHCQKGILTPAGTWLRTVETCIICSSCLHFIKLVLISHTLHSERIGEEPGETGCTHPPSYVTNINS